MNASTILEFRPMKLILLIKGNKEITVPVFVTSVECISDMQYSTTPHVSGVVFSHGLSVCPPV